MNEVFDIGLLVGWLWFLLRLRKMLNPDGMAFALKLIKIKDTAVVTPLRKVLFDRVFKVQK